MQTTDNTWDLIQNRSGQIFSDSLILEAATTIHKAIGAAKEKYPRSKDQLFDPLLAIESRMSSLMHPMNRDKVKNTELLDHINSLTHSYICAVDAAVTIIAASLLEISDEEFTAAARPNPSNIISIDTKRQTVKRDEDKDLETLEGILSGILPSITEKTDNKEDDVPDFIGSDNQVLSVKTIPVDIRPGENVMDAIIRAIQEHQK